MRTRRIVGAIAGGVFGALLIAAPASAAPETEVVQGTYVRLVSTVDGALAEHMQPGETMRWDLEISADAPEPGTLTVAVSATGETPLILDAALCMDAWQGDACPGGAEELRTAWEVPRDGEQIALGDVGADDIAHVRLHVGIASGSAGAATELRVYAIGAGEEIGTGPDLPPTGGWSEAPWLLGGGAMLLAGTAALLIVRAARSGDGGAT